METIGGKNYSDAAADALRAIARQKRLDDLAKREQELEVAYDAAHARADELARAELAVGIDSLVQLLEAVNDLRERAGRIGQNLQQQREVAGGLWEPSEEWLAEIARENEAEEENEPQGEY